jgi:hypothetical protein
LGSHGQVFAWFPPWLILIVGNVKAEFRTVQKLKILPAAKSVCRYLKKILLPQKNRGYSHIWPSHKMLCKNIAWMRT